MFYFEYMSETNCAPQFDFTIFFLIVYISGYFIVLITN